MLDKLKKLLAERNKQFATDEALEAAVSAQGVDLNTIDDEALVALADRLNPQGGLAKTEATVPAKKRGRPPKITKADPQQVAQALSNTVQKSDQEVLAFVKPIYEGAEQYEAEIAFQVQDRIRSIPGNVQNHIINMAAEEVADVDSFREQGQRISKELFAPFTITVSQ